MYTNKLIHTHTHTHTHACIQYAVYYWSVHTFRKRKIVIFLAGYKNTHLVNVLLLRQRNKQHK